MPGKESRLSTQHSADPLGVANICLLNGNLINIESYMHMEMYIDIFQFENFLTGLENYVSSELESLKKAVFFFFNNWKCMKITMGTHFL